MQADRARGNERGENATYDPSPSRALDTRRLGVNLLLQSIQTTKVLVDELLELSSTDHLGLFRTGGGQVLPEQ